MSRPDDEPDPIDEMTHLIAETLAANALRLTSNRGGYRGGGLPHATVDSDPHAILDVAKGLLARKVSGPPETVTYCDKCPHAMFLHEADGACGGGCHV